MFLYTLLMRREILVDTLRWCDGAISTCTETSRGARRFCIIARLAERWSFRLVLSTTGFFLSDGWVYFGGFLFLVRYDWVLWWGMLDVVCST